MRIVLGVAIVMAVGCGSGSDADAGPTQTSALAAGFRSARVDATLESASRVVRTRGFAAEGDAWRGFLIEQGTDVRPLPLRTGSCYVVVGVGSTALRELELRIFDGDGGEVARDGEQGPIAALRFCPAQNGTYYAVSRAAAGSGLYSAREFRGPTGLAFRMDDVLRAITPVTPAERDPG
ncbi:MAG: hypothetical protein M3Y87_27665 [Myxococcota bacterium]|nr:hypothetical protein [Myxococcota bacterium]